MTHEKKSKSEKLKFLKLMGHKNAEAFWDEIEEQIKGNNKVQKTGNAIKKANDELERQFAQGRNTIEKRGLGRWFLKDFTLFCLRFLDNPVQYKPLSKPISKYKINSNEQQQIYQRDPYRSADGIVYVIFS